MHSVLRCQELQLQRHLLRNKPRILVLACLIFLSCGQLPISLSMQLCLFWGKTLAAMQVVFDGFLSHSMIHQCYVSNTHLILNGQITFYLILSYLVFLECYKLSCTGLCVSTFSFVLHCCSVVTRFNQLRNCHIVFQSNSNILLSQQQYTRILMSSHPHQLLFTYYFLLLLLQPLQCM